MKRFLMSKPKQAAGPWHWLAAGLLAACTVSTHAQQQGFGGGGGGASTTTRTYPSNTQVGEALITSDPQTRSLIIVTDEATNEDIKRVLQSLDRPKPQALINVVFLQVTHNNELDLGVEGSIQHTPDAGQTGTATTDFGIAAAQALAGGGIYNFVSDDVTVLIRALSVAGKTEILSRPSILARNNQQATINIGQRIPIITGTTFNATTGTPNNQYQYQNIGIILRVTPFINPDNTVEMIVSPEISALSDTKIDIGAGVLVPAIDNRSADTVVVVESGKTVVIGGLIANQKIERDTKVPILGDIPLIGYAFKRKQKQNTKTELLIMMTPTVLQHPKELAKATLKETQKLKMAPEIFEKEDLDRFNARLNEEASAESEEPAESESVQDLRKRALQYMEQQQNAQPAVPPATP